MVEPTLGELRTKRSANLRVYSVPNMQVRFLPIHEPISFLRFSCSGRYGEHIRERETGVLETVWLENQN